METAKKAGDAQLYQGKSAEEAAKAMGKSNSEHLKERKAGLDTSDSAKKSIGFVGGLTKSAKAMIGNIGAMMAISGIMTLLDAAWQDIDKTLKITKGAKLDAMKEAVYGYNDAVTESKENIGTLKSLETEFNTLSKGVDSQGHNIGLTTEQFERYHEIVAQIVALNPSLVTSYDAAGNAIINQGTAIASTIEQQEKALDKAKETYITQSSIADIFNGNREQSKDAIKSMRGALANYGDRNLVAGKGFNKVQSDTAQEAAIEKVLGREVNLQKLSLADLKDISDHREQILGTMRETLNTDDKITKSEEEQLANFDESLKKVAEGSEAYSSYMQSTVDVLRTKAQDANWLSGLPDNMVEAYNAGLQDIVLRADNDTQATKMAQNLADDLKKAYQDGNVTSAMNEVKKIQDDFMAGDRTEKSANKAQKAIQDQLTPIQELIDGYDQLAKKASEAGDEEEAARYRALSSAMSAEMETMANYPQANILTLADAFNPLIDKITEARTVKEKFDAAMAGGDYDTTVNSYKEMYDSMMDGYNNAGNGTQGFWNFAELTLGQTALKDFGYDIDAVNARLKELAPVMEKTESGTDAFFDLLADNRDKLNQIEGVTIAEDGSWDIPAEKYGEVARQLGIAEDLLVGCVDNARHWADVKLWDSPQKAVKAIKDMDTTFESAEGKAYAFYDTVAQQAQQAGLSGQEFTEYMEEIGKQVELIDLDKLNFDMGTDKGKENAKEVADQLLEMNSALERNGKLDLTGTTAMFKDMGKTADETTHALEQFEAAGLLDTGDIDLEQFGGNIGDFVNQAFGTIDQNNPFEGMENSVNNMSAAINNLVATLGGVPEDWLNIDSQIAKIDEASAKGQKMTQEQYDNARKIWQEERNHQTEILNNKNSTDAQRRQASKNIEALNRSGQRLEKQAYNNGLTTDEQFERRMKASGDRGNTAAYEEERGALNALKTELNEASEAGAKFRDTQHGNIEQGKGQRQVLDWNTESLEKNKDALLSWSDEEITNQTQREAAWKEIQKQYDGSISTVDTMSGGFTGNNGGPEIPIAFTPLLQTESGQPVYLDKDNVSGYVSDVITAAQQLTEQNGGNLFDNIMAIDASPVDYLGEKWQQNGELIHGIIADVGETARQTGEQLHYIGDDGSVALAFQNVEQAARAAGMTVTDYINNLSASKEESQALNDEYMQYLAMRQDEYSSMGAGEVSIAVTADVSSFEASLNEITGLTGQQHEAIIKGVVEFEQSGGTDIESLTESLMELPPEVRTEVITQLQGSGNQELVEYANILENLPPELQTSATVEAVVDYILGHQEQPDDESAGLEYNKTGQEDPEDGSAGVGYSEIVTQTPPEDKEATVTYVGGETEGAPQNVQGTATYNAEFNGAAAAPPLAGVATYTPEYPNFVAPSLTGTASYSASGFPSKAPTVYGDAYYTAHGLHTGTPNRRVPSLASGSTNRRTFGSAASDGKLGPHGKGGLTLTGELGPELVWLPDEDTSFLTGVRGPEMQVLPGNAVVWPYEETKRIFGGTVSAGYLNTRNAWSKKQLNNYLGGSSARGANYQFGSAKKGSKKKKSWSDYSDRIDFNYDIERISEETYYKQLSKKYKKVKKKLTGKERRNARKAIHDAYVQMLEAKVESLDFAQDMDKIDAAQYYTKLAALAAKYKKSNKTTGKYAKEYREYQLKLKEAADAIYEREKSQIDFMLNLGVNKSGTKTYNAVDAYKDLQNYLRKAISGKVTSNTSTKTLTSASYAKKFLYTGTSNRRQPIRSMARGSGRIGPAGRGGLTLTGELGPELVWLPDDNLSFVVGLYGPEMVNLPSNAVVWPNDETQAIFGDTVNSSYLEPTDALTYEELEYLESLLSGSVANGANLFGSLSTGKRKKTTTKTTKTTKRPAKSTKTTKKKKKTTKKKKKAKKKTAKNGIISSIKTSSKLISGVNKGKSSSAKSNTDTTWNAMSEEERQQLLEDLKEARQNAYDYQNDTFERILNNSFSDDWNALNKYLVDAQNNLKTLNELQDSDKIIEARQQIVDTFFDNLNEKFDDVKEKISDNDLFNSWGDGESALTLLMQYKAQLETIYAANKDALGKDTDAAKQYLKLIKEVNRELVNAKAEAKDKYDDIFKLVEQLVRQEKKDLIDALEKQKDKYDDIIAKKKEILQLTENELDYQDQLSDYAKQEAKLRTQIASLSRDTSREAKAKRAELQEQLDQLLVEKNRTVRQETISRTNDALDKQQESYGDFIDKLTESINAVLDNQEAVNALVYDALDNRDTNNLLQRLYDYNAEYGDGLIQTVEEWQMDLNDIVENEIYKELKYQTEALRASLINEVGYGDDAHKGKFTDDVTSWNNETISRFLYSFDQLSDKYFDEAKLLDTIIEKYEELIKKFDALWFGDSSGQVDATSKIRMANAYKAQVESAEATVQTAAGQADDALIAANTAKAQAEAAKSEADAKKAEADVANANLDAAKQKVANAQKQLQSDKAAYSNAEKNVVNANKALDSALNARDKAASKVAKMQNALETAKAKSYKSKEARSKAIAKAKDNLAAAKSAYTTANKNVTTANDNVKKQHQNLVEIDKKIGNDIKSIESAQAAAAIAEKEAAAATQVWESFLAAQREAEVNAKLAMYQYDAMAQNLANATQELEIARERFESANTALLNAMDNDVIVPSYNILSDAAQSLDGVLSTFANTNLVSDEIMAGIASLGASVNTTNQANNSPQTYSFNMPFTVTVNGNMSQADQAKLQSDLSNAVYNGLYNALQMNGLATSTSANALKN